MFSAFHGQRFVQHVGHPESPRHVHGRFVLGPHGNADQIQPVFVAHCGVGAGRVKGLHGLRIGVGACLKKRGASLRVVVGIDIEVMLQAPVSPVPAEANAKEK